MNCFDLKFRVKTASCEAITAHLTQCADCFAPPLYSYVNIKEYGKKIFDNAVTFEAWDGGKLVGLISAYYNDRETGFGYITNVSAFESYQALGIASNLLDQAIDYGRKNGFSKVSLEVESDNIKALRLYEKHDFVSEGAVEDCKKIKMFLEL
ncbi:MAG: GNAT family N-acetyltransferase [Paludibacter sp.]|nr:GNAT family N-acetyltransferase [Paludibacter sp.]MDD4072543.1 GNAT family N-acetyltransferase [Desulfobacterales bacterium]MDD4428529.1 GNAT family N-acetyltransferase [Paludibacter sp.]